MTDSVTAAPLPVQYDDILAARERITGHVRLTPMIQKAALGRDGVTIHLKGEHLQRTGSFKLRGALNVISQLTDEERARGVVAASAGNHAQGVAVAAEQFGVASTIFMPLDATLSKVEATAGYGARVELSGDHLGAALDAAREHSRVHGSVLVHPFDDPRIIAGQGTLGLEIVEQTPNVATLVVPVGGGGLCSGIAVAVKHLRPMCRIIAVQSTSCPSLIASQEAGHPVQVEARPTMADGIAVKQPGAATFAMMQQLVDEVVLVDDNDLSRAMLWLMERSKQVVEGAGAASLAALLSQRFTPHGDTVCLLSGGNIDPMALMPVIRHGLSTVGRFLRVETTLPDRPGELSRLLALLARERANVMSVEHRREGIRMQVGDAHVELTLQTRNREHVTQLVAVLGAEGYDIRMAAR